MPNQKLWLWCIVIVVPTVQYELSQLNPRVITMRRSCNCYSCDLYRKSPIRPAQARKMMKSRKASKDEHKQRLAHTDKTGFAAIRAAQREYNRRNLYESSG